VHTSPRRPGPPTRKVAYRSTREVSRHGQENSPRLPKRSSERRSGMRARRFKTQADVDRYAAEGNGAGEGEASAACR
jgi:hypothetical protein